MPDLLFLCHRIPYPPNKGEKIRAYRFFEHLARTYRIHLGCFVDDPDDVRHEAHLANMCASAHFTHVSPRLSRARSALGFLNGMPLSVVAFRHPDLAGWVHETLARINPPKVFLYSSAVAQYIQRAEYRRRRVVMDFVDVDSDKWRQYAASAPWPLSTIYSREAAALLRHDRQVARDAAASILVSEAEAELFRKLAPESASKISAVSNGIDCEFFAPRDSYPNPYPAGGTTLVFTGTMDYRPNIDAVMWFVREILPAIRSRVPDVRFAIVGAKPTADVKALEEAGRVIVTGRVEDVRPYIQHATAVVAPLRLARGIQNKVLEGMAMGKAVITTPQGLEGITAAVDHDICVAGTAREFADSCIALLGDQMRRNSIGERARHLALNRYGWQSALSRLGDLVEGGVTGGT